MADGSVHVPRGAAEGVDRRVRRHLGGDADRQVVHRGGPPAGDDGVDAAERALHVLVAGREAKILADPGREPAAHDVDAQALQMLRYHNAVLCHHRSVLPLESSAISRLIETPDKQKISLPNHGQRDERGCYSDTPATNGQPSTPLLTAER